MNKRYMDFVPTRRQDTVGVKRVTSVATATSVAILPQVEQRRVKPLPARSPRVIRRAPVRSSLPEDVSYEEKPFTLKDGPDFGVIEDLQPKFTKTEVQKRPLNNGQSHFANNRGTLAEAKAQKVGVRSAPRVVEKSVEKVTRETSTSVRASYQTPNSPFINQGSVEKRPLSKNVYQKQVVTYEEKPAKPVTIITKEEKDKHVSIVVAIILTIILGAAAGTVAFLLLPK